MSRILLQIGFFILLISILMSFSCAKKEVKEFGEYEEVSIDWMDMRVRGNCMPIELEGISVHSTIHVADERITDLTFLTPNEIACITAFGKIFICDIDTGSVKQIADFMESLITWKLIPHNHNELLVVSRDFQSGSSESYNLACMDKDGGIYWHDDNLNFPSGVAYPGPFFDGDDYYFMDKTDADNISLYKLNSDGNVILQFNIFGQANVDLQMTDDQKFYWIDLSAGPYYSVRDDEGYSDLTLWNTGWDGGLMLRIVDTSEKIIGFKFDSGPEGDFSNLIILEMGDEKPIDIDFNRDLDLDLREIFSPWYSNWRCASDGDTVVFTSTHYLLKYQTGELEIWHDNLQDYGDNWEIWPTLGSQGDAVEYRDVLSIRSLFTDHDSSHFIMLFQKAILYGGDEIEVIDLPETISTDLQFTPDFQRACLALEDGSIVVLDIEGTPVDQN